MNRLGWLVVFVVVATGCKQTKDKPPAPAPPAATPTVDRAQATAERNKAIQRAPFDYKMTAEPCDVATPQTAASPDVTAIEASAIDSAPPTRGDPDRGFETIVISEVRGGDTEIGRIFVWDRAAKTMRCATAYNLHGPDVLTQALQSKLFKNIATSSIKPQVVDRLPARTGKRVVKVAIGNTHFCALIEDGTVRCFGQNVFGESGRFGADQLIAVPFTVPRITDAIDVVAGTRQSCVRRKSGVITCWGSNESGELGPGKPEPDQMVTQSLGKVTQLAAGYYHTCALRADGAVLCWGKKEPTRRVADLEAAVEICTTESASCARLKSGGIHCWDGGFGDKPVLVPGSESATGMACGTSAPAVCWVDAAHHASCATHGGPLELPTLHDVARVQVGSNHACALHLDGTVDCWGENHWGQLGTGVQDSPETETGELPLRSEPRPVKPLVGVTQLAIGSKRTAAILPDGALATWGYGPIGDGRACDGPPCDGLVPTVIPITE